MTASITSDLRHAWNVTPKQAIEIQKTLREKIILKPLGKTPKLIAGVDVSMNMFSTTVHAGFVVMTFPELRMVDVSVVQDIVTFPYIPGFLSFREIPSLMKAWEKLNTKPEIIFVDGVGIAHPRRLGIASHLGLMLNLPTIGCAKNILTGKCADPKPNQGSWSYLKDRDEILGAAVRTKDNVKPMYISPGHLMDVDGSIDLVLQCVRKHRMPEPTRYAHLKTNEFRKKANDEMSGQKTSGTSSLF